MKGRFNMKMYEMIMEFEVTVGLKDLNDLLCRVGGPGEKIGVAGYTLTITQTTPFIPNDEYLNKVAGIIKEKYKPNNLEILDCKFRGYQKFLEKEVDETTIKVKKDGKE